MSETFVFDMLNVLEGTKFWCSYVSGLSVHRSTDTIVVRLTQLACRTI